MMRALCLIGLLIATPAAAIDPTVPGDYTELFEVPNVFPCPEISSVCHGLQYTIRNSVYPCLRYEDIRAQREDGTSLPVKIEETGMPGHPGYTLDAFVDEAGAMLFHVRVVDVCGEG